MDGGAWWAAVHGVTNSWTWLSDFTFTFHSHALEEEVATHSGVLAWRIPGTGEPGGLPSMGSHRVGHNWNDLAAVYKNYLAHGGLWGGDLVILIPLSECPPDTRYHWAKVSADQKEPCKRALKITGSENQLFFQVNTRSVPYSCETLGKLFCLSEHLFLHLKDGDNNSTYLEGILWTHIEFRIMSGLYNYSISVTLMSCV